MRIHSDRWGELIPRGRRTFSIALLFRVTTLIAASIGWIIVVSKSTTFSPVVIFAAALVLASVAAYRQSESWRARLAVFLGFSVGVAFVGGLMPAFLRVLALPGRIESRTGAEELDLAFALFVAVPAAAVAFWLTRSWVFIADGDTTSDYSR